MALSHFSSGLLSTILFSKNHPHINSLMFRDSLANSMLSEPRVLFVWVCGSKEVLSLLYHRDWSEEAKGKRELPCWRGSLAPLTTSDHSQEKHWASSRCVKCHLLFTQWGVIVWEWRGHPSLFCQKCILFPAVSLWSTICVFAWNNKRGLFSLNRPVPQAWCFQ